MKAHKEVRKQARRVIGEYLEEILKDKNLNAFELSARFQIPLKSVNKVINGKKYNFDFLLEILQCLDMRIEIMPKDIKKSYPDIKEN